MDQPRSRLVGSLLLGAACIFSAGRADAATATQSAEAERLFALTVPVFDADTPIGTISARVGRGGDYRLPVASLLPILQGLYSSDEFEAIGTRLQGLTEVGPEDATRLRLPFRFDMQRVAFILDIPTDQRGRRLLELGATGRAPEPTASRRAPEEFSAYLNLNFGIVDDPTLSSARTRGTLLLEGAVRLAGFTLENVASVEAGGVDGRAFIRQGTRLTRDFPSAGIRASAGDLFTPSVGFIGSLDILGVSAFRNVDVFDPFQISRPVGREAFALAEASDVDIFVNGALVRQARLQPGTYDLTNFPQVEGANDVRVEVRSSTGRTQTFAFSSFFDADLLAPGITQWEFGAGVRANRFNRQLRYDFDDVVAAGFYRRGITDTLTLGANGRYVDGQTIVGAEAIAATSIANISFDLAASRSAGKFGGAVALTFQPRLPRSWQARGRTVDGFVEYVTRSFGDNALSGSGRGFRIGARYSEALIDNRLIASANVAYREDYGPGRDGFDISASFAYRFDNNFVLRVTPEYRQTSFRESAASIRVSLTRTFGRTSRANASYDTRRNRYLAEYDYRSQYNGIGTLAANVTVSGADDQERVADAFVDYTANRFEVSGGYSHILEDGRVGDLGRVRLNLGTAIAFAGGEMAIGRPVRDSFAIVRAHPNLEDRQVIVGPRVNGQGDRARSGALGPALLPDLGSYSLSRILYDVIDLPPGYDLGTGVLEFFPPYRSGYSATIGSNRLATAIGIATDTGGQPLPLAVGTATSTTDREFAPQQVFTNRSGRFGVVGLVPGNVYEITFGSGRKVRIEVPANATGLVNVGSVTATGD